MLLVAGLCFADGKKHKLSRDVEAFKSGHSGATVDVIIQFNQTPTTTRVVWGNGVVWGDVSTDKSTAMSQGGMAITGEN